MTFVGQRCHDDAVGAASYEIRRAGADDRPAIISLCERSLDWKSHDPNAAFYAWKHDDNPWGASPTWVAVTPGGEIIGLRAFLRWRFKDAAGTSFDAVRAVDTATDPAFQGQGIFSRLTLGALPKIAEDGVAFVFNTPNERSRPGYLKMGWAERGIVPAAVRLANLHGLPRIAASRSSAELWSLDCAHGQAAGDFFDTASVERLISAQPVTHAFSTELSAAHLRWRYGFDPLKYRIVPVGDNPEDGAVIFRLRRRAKATEFVIALVLTHPQTTAHKLRACIRQGLRATNADYALATTGTFGSAMAAARIGFIQIPKLGPVLTTRSLREHGSTVDPPKSFRFSLGDIELF